MGATRVSVPHARLQDREDTSRECGTLKLWDTTNAGPSEPRR